MDTFRKIRKLYNKNSTLKSKLMSNWSSWYQNSNNKEATSENNKLDMYKLIDKIKD